MENNWIKFQYDDGAEVFYKIDESEETVTFMEILYEQKQEMVTVFFDEVKEVYAKILALSDTENERR